MTEEDSLSLDSQGAFHSGFEVEICQDFVLKGSCMRGGACVCAHESSAVVSAGLRRERVRDWLWSEMP